MPGQICAIGACKNKWEKNCGLSFYVFPKNADLRRVWIFRTGRKDNFNPDTSRVCSVHFKDEDFEGDLKAELLQLPARRILKSEAIPSLKLTKKDNDIEPRVTETDREKRMERRALRDIVNSLCMTEEDNPIDFRREASTQTDPCSGCMYIGGKYTFLQSEHTRLMAEYVRTAGKVDGLMKQICSLQKEVEKYQKLSENLQKEGEENTNALKGVFSTAQMALLYKKKRKVIWSSEDISVAFSIWYLSIRTYCFLREKLHYPLPGLSSLRRWASNLELNSGVILQMFHFLKAAGEKREAYEKVTVLSYDEMKISTLYEYSKKYDQVIGPHKQVQTLMARGLFDSWKQPLFVAFDCKMTKRILEDIITRLHNIEYDVVACVSGCGGGNIGLWSSLGVNTENTFFPHPVSRDPIYMFPDAPHLLKLIRNWLLDTGFVLPDGKFANQTSLRKLIGSNTSEVSAIYKITSEHVNVVKSRRQNVRLAAELLSRTTAIALKHHNLCVSQDFTADFILQVNNWFDVMNSRTTSESISYKRPYGLHEEEQNKILDSFLHTVENMRCVGKNSIQTFQKGVIISIKSIKALRAHVLEKYKMCYIMTYKLNQDCLENFFSQIRGSGGPHEHPSPLNFFGRVKLIILGKNSSFLHENKNTSDVEESEYVTANLLKVAHIDPVSPGENIMTDDEEDQICAIETPQSAAQVLSADLEDDGLEYLAGYIAFRFKDKYSLGSHSYKKKFSSTVPSWVQHLSFGGLLMPNSDWFDEVQKMNSFFKSFHPQDSFQRIKNITEKASKDYILSTHTAFSQDVFSFFFKIRLFIRIRYLNLRLQLKKLDQPKRTAKKLKKTTS